MAHDVLIVDDEADIRMLIAGVLKDEGYATREAADTAQTLAAIQARQPTLVILDIWLQGGGLEGIEILKQLRVEMPSVPVVMISGHGTIETAVEAIKLGAYDFLEKPFKSDRLLLVVERAIEAARLPPREFGEDAMAALQAYTWPGNVRQLRNVIDWLLIMAPGDVHEPVRADMLPNEITAIAPTVVKWDKGSEIMTLPLRDAREVFEREYLLAQVTRFGGNISRTAAFVGMERSALHRKLKSLGVFGNDRPLKVGA